MVFVWNEGGCGDGGSRKRKVNNDGDDLININAFIRIKNWEITKFNYINYQF